MKRPGSRYELVLCPGVQLVTRIQARSFEEIWKSDGLILKDLREWLKAAVAPLENIPDFEKAWRPGSNGQVLDLAHPRMPNRLQSSFGSMREYY